MNNQYQIIAIIGESASGKDTVLKKTVEKHPELFHTIVSCTTRPKRDYEINGIDYLFLTIEDFTKKVLNGEMLEATDFNNWFYGTAIDSLSKEKINIGVFNPAGVEALLEDPRLNVEVVRVLCDDKTRLMRALNREQSPNCEEICRRFFTDKKDFSNINFDYWILDNYKDTGSFALDLLCESNSFTEWINEMKIKLNNE